MSTHNHLNNETLMPGQDSTIENKVNTKNGNFFESDEFKIFHSVTERNYLINPFYIKLTGSVTSGYFLTQLIFLARAFNYGEFYKTDEYFIEKLNMTEWEVRNHKKILIDLGFVSVIKAGFPAKSHYKINLQKIIQMAKEDLKPPKTGSHEETSSLEKPTSKQSEKDGNRTEVSSVQSRGNLVTGLYNNNLYNNNNNTFRCNSSGEDLDRPVVVSDLKIILDELEIPHTSHWLKKYPESKIREKLSCMPDKSKIKASAAAWLRGALERDYHPPKNVSTVENGGFVGDGDYLKQKRFQEADEEYKRRMKEYRDMSPETEKRFFDVPCGLVCELMGA